MILNSLLVADSHFYSCMKAGPDFCYKDVRRIVTPSYSESSSGRHLISDCGAKNIRSVCRDSSYLQKHKSGYNIVYIILMGGTSTSSNNRRHT